METVENDAIIATFLGAAPATIETVEAVCARGSILVAVDGGVTHATAAGRRPDLILGDFDSLPDRISPSLSDVPKQKIPDQDSTDFDKALRNVEADLYLCAGFVEGRVDHLLACFHTLLKRPEKKVILVSGSDAITLLPPEISVRLEGGTRVSVFPLKPGRGRSEGLRWPLEGLALDPGVTVSTSNEAVKDRVRISVDGPHSLLILPRQDLDALIFALLESERWPAIGQ